MRILWVADIPHWCFDRIGQQLHKHGKHKYAIRYGRKDKYNKYKTFKDMERSRHTSHTITQDGNAYVTKYDDLFEHAIPICKQHTYENKIQCSQSVFNFQTVDDDTKSQYCLFEYPKENLYNFNPILGKGNAEASNVLRIYNALNGSKRQLHMMLLVFNGQPLEAGLYQEAYWKGGNKNEFIVCVGLNEDNIKWVKIISWTESEVLKAKVAREIKEMKHYDPMKIVNYMGETIPDNFVRRQFAEFSYISVQPTTRAVISTYIISIFVCVIVSTICIVNGVKF